MGVYILALVMRHLKCMRPTILLTMISVALPYFLHRLIKGTNFVNKYIIEHKTCVLIFSTTLPDMYLILRRTQPSTINSHRSSFEVHVIHVTFK
jgi:hypothetical protein